MASSVTETGPAGTAPVVNNYRYAGEQWDGDLGLYYNRARYLSTATGRFWSMDSYEGSPADPTSLHKYLYCHANPVNGIDPSGKMTVTQVAASLRMRLIGFSAHWNSFAFTEGGVTLTRYYRTQGRFSERVVNMILSSSQELIQLANPQIDHLFRVGSETIAIETKYSASRKGTEGFTRLIGQINYMLNSPNITQANVYFTKAPSQAQLRHIADAVGAA